MNINATALVLVALLVGVGVGVSIAPNLTRVSAHSVDAKYKYKGRATRLKTPRITPIDPKDYTPEQKAVAGAGANANIRTALHNPGLGKAWWSWLQFVHDNPGTRAKAGEALPQIDKELVVMRTNYLNNDDWVWSVHVPMAIAWGRSKEDVARIAKGPDAPGWNEKDAALVRSADELHAQAFITDQTWTTLTKYYNTGQMLDIIFLAGVYATNAYFANTVGLEFTPGMRMNNQDVVWNLPE